MINNIKETGKITKRVRLFLSWDPLTIIEGTLSIPGVATRLSDVVNDDRPFLSVQDVQDVVAPKEWMIQFSKFALLNKNEIKAITELE